MYPDHVCGRSTIRKPRSIVMIISSRKKGRKATDRQEDVNHALCTVSIPRLDRCHYIWWDCCIRHDTVTGMEWENVCTGQISTLRVHDRPYIQYGLLTILAKRISIEYQVFNQSKRFERVLQRLPSTLWYIANQRPNFCICVRATYKEFQVIVFWLTTIWKRRGPLFLKFAHFSKNVGYNTLDPHWRQVEANPR